MRLFDLFGRSRSRRAPRPCSNRVRCAVELLESRLVLSSTDPVMTSPPPGGTTTPTTTPVMTSPPPGGTTTTTTAPVMTSPPPTVTTWPLDPNTLN
jgi:hypothetical protein